MATRPSLKRPGITATGRQWKTIEALRSDGWFVLEANPFVWSEADIARVEAALHAIRNPPVLPCNCSPGRERDCPAHGHGPAPGGEG